MVIAGRLCVKGCQVLLGCKWYSTISNASSGLSAAYAARQMLPVLVTGVLTPGWQTF